MVNINYHTWLPQILYHLILVRTSSFLLKFFQRKLWYYKVEMWVWMDVSCCNQSLQNGWMKLNEICLRLGSGLEKLLNILDIKASHDVGVNTQDSTAKRKKTWNEAHTNPQTSFLRRNPTGFFYYSIFPVVICQRLVMMLMNGVDKN